MTACDLRRASERDGDGVSNPRTATQVVLWDLDRTMVDAGLVSQRALERAIETVCGPTARSPLAPASTDLAVVSETIRDAGLTPTPGLIDSVMHRMFAEFDEQVADLRAQGRSLPGARSAQLGLSRLGFVQTVVTGSSRHCAKIKLDLLLPDNELLLECGAFGDELPGKAALLRLATARLEVAVEAVTQSARFWVVGDSLDDLAAAREVGYRVALVATGAISVRQAVAAGADLVLTDLRDWPALARAMVS